ncbi:MAG: DUF3857 domain-containing protein [Methanococcaceae archaeon]
MSFSHRIIILLIGLTGICANSYGQKYKVSDIPKDLLANAKAVVRDSEIEFEIKDSKTAVARISFAITILNTNSLKNSVLDQYYNKFMSVRKINWALYDQNGNFIKNSSNIKLEDFSAISGYSLYEDTRVKHVDPKYRTLPFTVVYSFEIAYNGLLNYPIWRVYSDYNISVQRSVFKILTPEGFKFRYLQRNFSDSCSVTNSGGKTCYTWSASNQQAVIQEPYSDSFEEYTPVVYSAPNEFQIGGYSGNCETWNGFGKWINEMDKGRDVLSEESVMRIKNLISGAQSDFEKVAILYRFMQNKVRYVSTQIGIGGMQTIEAEKVDRLSYGDCKALSNYMKSLLSVAGIKSYYALVLAGENSPSFISDFPSNQFNHAIVCVPLEKDTIWLECTDQHIPAGYIGKFTDSRKALLTSENGGFLVHTKEYTLNENIQCRHAVLELKNDGNAESLIRTSYKGLFYDDVFRILMLDNEDRKRFLQSRISIPSYDITGFNHSENRQIIPSVEEELRLSLKSYGTIVGTRMLINPNVMTRFRSITQRTHERRSTIKIKRPYCETDTTIIKLPPSYKADPVSGKISISSEFGQYTTDLEYNDKEIRYIRTFKFYKGDYAVDRYSDFMSFCEKVSGMDNRNLVLEKK